MRVLVIGSGGREHAICWKLRQSESVEELYAAPGNPGIAELADCVPIAPDDVQKLADFATDLKVDLTVVGPELPLVLGIVDEFRDRGLAVFGPTREAAQLEGSKIFAKEFMLRHEIPTARFVIAHDENDAKQALKQFGLPIVLKADGLAAGKGVLIPKTEAEFADAVEVLFQERRFGASGDRVLIEECLVGEEVSVIGVCDGERVLPLATSKDYKRIGEGDEGPNTGGMGAHSPSGVLSAKEGSEILASVMRRTVEGMKAERRPFAGFLYAGIMLTDEGPRVLEYNVRLGDPEAQPLLMRLEEDLAEVLLEASRRGFGDRSRLHFRHEVSACVVLAAEGYPGKARTGDPIVGIDTALESPNVQIFHAGTSLDGGALVTAGGRVLNVCATGDDLREALVSAYEAAGHVQWPGRQVRGDIGRTVIERLSGA